MVSTCLLFAVAVAAALASPHVAAKGHVRVQQTMGHARSAVTLDSRGQVARRAQAGMMRREGGGRVTHGAMKADPSTDSDYDVDKESVKQRSEDVTGNSQEQPPRKVGAAALQVSPQRADAAAEVHETKQEAGNNAWMEPIPSKLKARVWNETPFFNWRPSEDELRADTPESRERQLVVAVHSGAYHGDYWAFYEGSVGPGTAAGSTQCEHKCSFLGRNQNAAEKADVVVFDAQDGETPEFEKRAGQIWIGAYWEAPSHYPSLGDDSYMSQFDYTTSYRVDSTIPMFAMMQDTTGNWSEILGHRPAISFAEKTSRKEMMSAWISNCNANFDHAQRMTLLTALQSHGIPVASYGKCDQNHRVPRKFSNLDGQFQKDREAANYLFLFSAENARCPHYHTEKVYQAFVAGVVPVYVGARTLVEWVPEHSVIMADDFATAADLAAYLKKVASSEDLYNSYLAWRDEPLPQTVQLKATTVLGTDQWRCNMCRFLHMHHPQGTAHADACSDGTILPTF